MDTETELERAVIFRTRDLLIALVIGLLIGAGFIAGLSWGAGAWK